MARRHGADSHTLRALAENDIEEEQCYRRALSVSPDAAVGYQGLGTLIARRLLTGKEDLRRLNEAKDLLERAVALDPTQFTSRYSLALLYMLLNRLEEAERELRAALVIEGRHAGAEKLLADLVSRKPSAQR